MFRKPRGNVELDSVKDLLMLEATPQPLCCACAMPCPALTPRSLSLCWPQHSNEAVRC